MIMAEAADPLVNALNRPFWEGTRDHRLMLPWCVDEARAFWPPAPVSPFTGGPVEWREAAGDGLVESVVVYRRAFQQSFASLLPYGIALVALDAGPRLLAHVKAPDDPASPRAGMRAMIAFRTLIDGAAPRPVAMPVQ